MFSFESFKFLSRYAKMCLSIACTPELDIAIRLKNYEYLKTTLASANPGELLLIESILPVQWLLGNPAWLWSFHDAF